jgi:hypothetical protein
MACGRAVAAAALLLALSMVVSVAFEEGDATDEVHSLEAQPPLVTKAAARTQEEVGEDAGVGRRAAALSTTGSFSLSSGGNTAGNDESLRLGDESKDDDEEDWFAKEKWPGAYNSTHADKKPRDSADIGKGGHCRGCHNCLTAVGKRGNMCTSCKPGTAFTMLSTKKRFGKCTGYVYKSQITRVGLTGKGSIRDQNMESTDILITKVVTTKNTIRLFPNRDSKKGFFKHFKKGAAKRPSGQLWLVPECRFRKEIACHGRKGKKGKVCQVRKQIECVRVCKFLDHERYVGKWPNGFYGPVQTGKTNGVDCFPELCKGKYSHLACEMTAMTE